MTSPCLLGRLKSQPICSHFRYGPSVESSCRGQRCITACFGWLHPQHQGSQIDRCELYILVQNTARNTYVSRFLFKLFGRKTDACTPLSDLVLTLKHEQACFLDSSILSEQFFFCTGDLAWTWAYYLCSVVCKLVLLWSECSASCHCHSQMAIWFSCCPAFTNVLDW